MPKRTPTAPPDPDKLIRQQAGTYRTPDERFEVREADLGWFLVDANQADDFGQSLVRGPFPTLKAVQAAIPEARSAKVSERPAPKPTRSNAAPKAAPKPPPPPPPSWIDELPPKERSTVRKLIRALDAAGVAKAEQLVRRDRNGLSPVVAETLLGRRLDEILDGASAETREVAAKIVELVTAEARGRGELPGWSLVEIGPHDDPPNRRISLRIG